MSNKYLVWCGNFIFASILVLLATTSVLQAQESSDTDTQTTSEPVDTGTTSPIVEDEDGNGTITIPLSGTASVNRVSNLTISPNRVEADLLEIGKSSTQTFTLTHSGPDDAPAISIEAAMLFGKSASEFSSNFNGFEDLYPGESRQYEVTFTPLTPGDKAAGLRLNIAGATAPYVVLFTGTARYPLTSDLGISDTKLDFGQAIKGSTPQRNFILTNEGESGAPAINVSDLTIEGTNANAFSTSFSPTLLNPGEQLDIKINMDTATVGYKSASLVIGHDGHNESLQLDVQGNVVTPESVPVNFSVSTLNTATPITAGTSIQFGPDGKLYVAEMDGSILVFNVTRNGKNNYSGTLLETINLIKSVENHNDDGTRDWASKRLLTGIHVTGSASAPVIYAASSDPRQAAGPSGFDSGLDTNSGILHKLTKSGGNWSKQDLVRGLPRSEENHVSNGLVKVGNKIYLSVGGNTNQGAPSNNFAELREYALSAAILEIDLAAIGNSTYDLPTLDGPADEYDPFGGHDGLNQAMLVQGGPVQIFAPGFRNAYDIVYTESGRFYTWDNGPNSPWGGTPQADCSDPITNGGNSYGDGLHKLVKGYYGGHPNPTRGSKDNKFGGVSPVQVAANPVECVYKVPGQSDGALTVNSSSTNGLDEYTASNFLGSMQGDLIAAAFNGTIYRVSLNSSGTVVTSKSTLAQNLGATPLDLTSQGDGDVFPGTIWVTDYGKTVVHILEPSDY